MLGFLLLLAAVVPDVSAFSSSALVSAVHSTPSRCGVARASETSTDTTSTTTDASSDKMQSKRRVSILLCPAQFCVPSDYDVLFDSLLKAEDRLDNGIEIGTCRVANLPRTEWIKVAKQLPTRAFLEARLPVQKTLGWYFDAMENTLADIFADEVCEI